MIIRRVTGGSAALARLLVTAALARLLVIAGLVVALATSAACTATEGAAPSEETAPRRPAGTAVPTAPTAYRMRPGVPQPVAGKVMLGSYLDLHGLSQAQSLQLRRKQLGRDPRVIHWFYAWQDVLPASYRSVPEGAVVMLSWRGTRYDKILNGSQDGHIAASARNLARYRKPVFLRFAWEMNGDWYEWSGPNNGNDPAAFVAAWQHVYKIFQAQGASNVGWVWSPNHQSKPTAGWNDLTTYYPGDAYVDWVGVTGYSEVKRLPDDVFEDVYRAYSGRKPLIVTETGVRTMGGRQSADWMRVLAQWFAAHPAACGLIWFDTDTHKRGTDKFTDFRLDRDPVLLDAYRRLATDPRFTG